MSHGIKPPFYQCASASPRMIFEYLGRIFIWKKKKIMRWMRVVQFCSSMTVNLSWTFYGQSSSENHSHNSMLASCIFLKQCFNSYNLTFWGWWTCIPFKWLVFQILFFFSWNELHQSDNSFLLITCSPYSNKFKVTSVACSSFTCKNAIAPLTSIFLHCFTVLIILVMSIDDHWFNIKAFLTNLNIKCMSIYTIYNTCYKIWYETVGVILCLQFLFSLYIIFLASLVIHFLVCKINFNLILFDKLKFIIFMLI